MIGKDKYPHLSKDQLCSRGWLLVRKVERAEEPTETDRRVAMLLLPHLSKFSSLGLLRTELELIAYGIPTRIARATLVAP